MTTTKRPPGRPRKAGEPTPQPGLTAELYLERVVAGELPADPSRVRAALGLIRYQSTAKRAPIPAPPPKAMEASGKLLAERAVATDFNVKAAEILKRHAAKLKKKES